MLLNAVTDNDDGDVTTQKHKMMVKATFSVGRPQASMASCNVVVTDDDGNIDVTMAKH